MHQELVLSILLTAWIALFSFIPCRKSMEASKQGTRRLDGGLRASTILKGAMVMVEPGVRGIFVKHNNPVSVQLLTFVFSCAFDYRTHTEQSNPALMYRILRRLTYQC
jgi:hypothetical protein